MNTGILKNILSIGLALMMAGAGYIQAADDRRVTRYSEAELDQLLAPIALYPDVLLSQILMAATYPLEVVEAHRWVERHPGVEGDEAVDAVTDQDWDPSVKALVGFPQVLARMDDDLEWTRSIGDAYLGQEEDVVEAVQRLRDHAYTQGALAPTEHTRVYRERDIVYIEPVSTSIIHVPYYSTRHVYSNWWWPDYPPHYWGPPRGVAPESRFFWGSGVRVTPRFFFSSFHWHNRHIVLLDRDNFLGHYSGPTHLEQRYRGHQRWYHNPHHRRGILYPGYYEPVHYSIIRNSDRRYYQGWSRDSYYPWRDQHRHRNQWQRKAPDRSDRRDDRSQRGPDRRPPAAGEFDRENNSRQWAKRTNAGGKTDGDRAGDTRARGVSQPHSQDRQRIAGPYRRADNHKPPFSAGARAHAQGSWQREHTPRAKSTRSHSEGVLRRSAAGRDNSVRPGTRSAYIEPTGRGSESTHFRNSTARERLFSRR